MKAGRAGMTLIEVVVGLVVASAVSAIGYAAFAAVTDQGRRIMAQSGDARAATVRRTIGEWLQSAVVVQGAQGSTFRGLDDVREGIPRDEVEFVTVAATPAGKSQTLVRLYIDTDSLTIERGLTAELRDWAGTTVQRIQLDTTVDALDARYTSSLVTVKRWMPSWVSSSVLPDVIELRFGGRNVDDLLTLPIVTRVGAPR